VKLLRDCFMGVGNSQWELARILAAWAIVSYSGAFLFALAAKDAVPDWSALGVGFAAVLAGSGAMIGIKDIARAKSLSAEPAPEDKP